MKRYIPKKIQGHIIDLCLVVSDMEGHIIASGEGSPADIEYKRMADELLKWLIPTFDESKTTQL